MYNSMSSLKNCLAVKKQLCNDASLTRLFLDMETKSNAVFLDDFSKMDPN